MSTFTQVQYLCILFTSEWDWITGQCPFLKRVGGGEVVLTLQQKKSERLLLYFQGFIQTFSSLMVILRVKCVRVEWSSGLNTDGKVVAVLAVNLQLYQSMLHKLTTSHILFLDGCCSKTNRKSCLQHMKHNNVHVTGFSVHRTEHLFMS